MSCNATGKNIFVSIKYPVTNTFCQKRVALEAFEIDINFAELACSVSKPTV